MLTTSVDLFQCILLSVLAAGQAKLSCYIYCVVYFLLIIK